MIGRMITPPRNEIMKENASKLKESVLKFGSQKLKSRYTNHIFNLIVLLKNGHRLKNQNGKRYYTSPGLKKEIYTKMC